MKKLLFLALLATCFFFTGCNDKQNGVSNDKGTIAVKIAPRKAQADKDGAAAMVTRFILQIEDLTAGTTTQMINNVPAGTTETRFHVELVHNRTYNFLFWADNAEGGYYLTSDLNNITMSGDYVGNDDARDAFSQALLAVSPADAFSHNITLYRPFGQLNIIATDILGDNEEETLPEEYKLTFDAPTSFDVAKQIASNNATLTSLNTELYGETIDGKTTVTMDYIFTIDDTNKDLIDFHFEAGSIDRNFTNVPMQRNYRTNLIGNLFSTMEDFVVIIEPTWYEPEDTIIANNVTTYEELKNALSSKCENLNISLAADIELTEHIGASDKINNLVINGEGHKLTGKSIYLYSKNVTLTNLVFANALNGNTSSIYLEGDNCTQTIVADKCTFYAASWENLQINNAHADSIVINECQFFTSSVLPQRYLHIQFPELSNTASVTITNNFFSEVGTCQNEVIGCYNVKNVTIKNNTYSGTKDGDLFSFMYKDETWKSIFTDDQIKEQFTHVE